MTLDCKDQGDNGNSKPYGVEYAALTLRWSDLNDDCKLERVFLSLKDQIDDKRGNSCQRDRDCVSDIFRVYEIHSWNETTARQFSSSELFRVKNDLLGVNGHDVYIHSFFVPTAAMIKIVILTTRHTGIRKSIKYMQKGLCFHYLRVWWLLLYKFTN